MNKFQLLSTLICLSTCFFVHTAKAQSNMSQIRTIFQAKCASCHTGNQAAGGLDLSGTEAQIYANIVNVASSTSETNEKLIDPGSPYTSFLLKKINNGLIHQADASLTANEGETMPPAAYTGTPLANNEIELVRQWIYRGAKQTGNTVNKAIIDQYYTDGGLTPIARPAAPANGFQIHLGPLFIAPNDEVEYALKHALNLPENVEVNRIEAQMSQQSHHFILYRFVNGNGSNIDAGLRDVGLFNNPFGDSDAEMVTTWQRSEDFRLPAGTAFKWNNNDVLDLNLHQPNPSETNILPSDVYINVYTQPLGTAVKEMKSRLLFYSSLFFVIPPFALNYQLEEPILNGDAQYNLWNISSHTHKLGVDYDVWDRNPNGTKGNQIFEGTVNGFYDYAHPHIDYFEPYHTIPQNQGIIHRALFTNPSSSAVTFGLTTDNEMMITIIQYTEGDPIPFVGVPHIQHQYCVNADPLVFQPAGGTISGAGTSGNQFLPSAAGVGTHAVSYTYFDAVSNKNITAAYDIIVTPAIAVPTIDNTSGTLATTGNYQSYQWYQNGNAISGATLNYYVPTASGVYTVGVMQDGCLTFSDGAEVVISGISPTPLSNANVWVYPNPYQNECKIQYELSQTADVSLAVYNTLGAKVADIAPLERQNAGTHTYRFDAKHLPTGVYFLQTNINGQTHLQKIVQQ